MRRKLLVVLISLFLLLAGACYSLTYKPKADIKSDLLTHGETVSEQDAGSGPKDEGLKLGIDEQGIQKQGADEQEFNQQGDNILLEDIIYVHVCGAVVNPGVYNGSYGSRIVDFIKLAGGLTEDAAGDYINQAQLAMDGQRLYIPTMEEVKELPTEAFIQGDTGDTGASGNVSKLVNINTADASELMSLPGIGQSKANSIIEYRKANGKFKTIEDLMKINGIKEGLFNKISPYITIK
ncbi:MAG: hypothetical protein GX288_09405 [Clostridiales bacterium]|nr:hypothetical protein [Clostridiales bacterium]